MTNQQDDKPPREFTFSFVKEPCGFNVLWGSEDRNDFYPIEDFKKYHVIEKSAYDSLEARLKIAIDALDRIDEIAFQNGYHSITAITVKAISALARKAKK